MRKRQSPLNMAFLDELLCEKLSIPPLFKGGSAE
jgi:hypothetical protein